MDEKAKVYKQYNLIDEGNANTEKSIEQKEFNFLEKLARMEEKLDAFQETTKQLSQTIVTKSEIIALLQQKDATSTIETDVEMTVVNESASYAKQLINLLEQAALNFVKEKREKDKLHEELIQTKRELHLMTQSKQQYEQQLVKVKKASKALQDQLIVKETELLATNEGYRSVEIQKKQFEENLKDAIAKLKQMNDELNQVKGQLAKSNQDKEELAYELERFQEYLKNIKAKKLLKQLEEETIIKVVSIVKENEQE